MASTIYKNIYKVIILIGRPDDQGNIIVTNASGNPKDGLPVIGSDLGVVVAEFLDLGYVLENVSTPDGGSAFSQYTLVRTYCIKYSI